MHKRQEIVKSFKGFLRGRTRNISPRHRQRSAAICSNIHRHCESSRDEAIHLKNEFSTQGGLPRHDVPRNDEGLLPWTLVSSTRGTEGDGGTRMTEVVSRISVMRLLHFVRNDDEGIARKKAAQSGHSWTNARATRSGL